MLRDLIYLFYPTYCMSCNATLLKNERTFCTSCRHHLPLFNFQYHNAENIKKVFFGRIPIANAAALLLFEKHGKVQHLIHNLKYNGQQHIGTALGQWLGNELALSTSFREVTTVIPVPLHRRRYQERGYNQVERFGKEIAKLLEATYLNNVLIKTKNTNKQAKSDKYDRWKNSMDAYEIRNAEGLEDHHVLLVDDLITTGATLEACAQQLLQIPKLKISIAVMAMAK